MVPRRPGGSEKATVGGVSSTRSDDDFPCACTLLDVLATLHCSRRRDQRKTLTRGERYWPAGQDQMALGKHGWGGRRLGRANRAWGIMMMISLVCEGMGLARRRKRCIQSLIAGPWELLARPLLFQKVSLDRFSSSGRLTSFTPLFPLVPSVPLLHTGYPVFFGPYWHLR